MHELKIYFFLFFIPVFWGCDPGVLDCFIAINNTNDSVFVQIMPNHDFVQNWNRQDTMFWLSSGEERFFYKISGSSVVDEHIGINYAFDSIIVYNKTKQSQSDFMNVNNWHRNLIMNGSTSEIHWFLTIANDDFE